MKDQVTKAKEEHTGSNSSEKIEKRGWKLRTVDKVREIMFMPIFKINTMADKGNVMVVATDKDVECRFVDIKYKDDKGEQQDLRFNFLDIFMFVYTCANEELRQQLNLRYERNYTRIPYDVTFNLTPEERASGKAKRLIELELDEVAMAMARAQANEIGVKNPQRYKEWFLKRKKVDVNSIKL